MPDGGPTPNTAGEPSCRTWQERLVAGYPQTPFALPFVTFLLLMAVEGQFDSVALQPYFYALRIIGAAVVVYLFRKHYPPLGKAHWPEAIVVGLIVAFGWVAIHHWFADRSWYVQPLGADPEPDEYYNPIAQLGTGVALWLFLLVRIGGAATVVPIIEEFFWRAFVLRLLINWNRFEDVPLGRFTWFSFLVCSLLSAAEHPQWEVGVLCWMVYNALFCWRKSLLCLMLTHGITNLALYGYVVVARDWVFW